REAEAALRGGAALIDVKEPAHGSLGRAPDSTIAEVVRTVAGVRPVSAALGELRDTFDAEPLLAGLSLSYVKWGLAGYPGCGERVWQDELSGAMRCLAEHQPNCRTVAVAYVDWQRARAPTPEEVCCFAVKHPVGAFLLDTWDKDGSTLLDRLPLHEVECLRQRCRAAGVPMALAGSLGLDEIRTLLPLCPDWFAVRGAVCQNRQRGAAIDEREVRRLAALLDEQRA
ncbi:MAG: (5-formylfuran-3-yl)methyl phosphate synthase, partial [Terriglobales bacterium]